MKNILSVRISVRTLCAALLLCGLFYSPAARADMTDMPVIKLQSLDKVSARTMTFEARVGSTVKFGSLYIKIQSCRKSSALDQPESAAFLQIWEVPPKTGQPHWVFSGWMFASSPALSAMDHPIYDVWVLDCQEKKTGELPPLPLPALMTPVKPGNEMGPPRPGEIPAKTEAAPPDAAKTGDTPIEAVKNPVPAQMPAPDNASDKKTPEKTRPAYLAPVKAPKQKTAPAQPALTIDNGPASNEEGELPATAPDAQAPANMPPPEKAEPPNASSIY